MQTFHEYLSKTETAAKVLFAGVNDYRNMLTEAAKATTFSSSYSDYNDLETQYAKWREHNAEKIARAEFLYNHYFAEVFSQATLCGSILQIASKAIEKYSTMDSIPADVEAAVGAHDRIKRFCIGRQVRTMPIGLIIYAGRNQHMHFEGKLQSPSQRIFNRIATAWDPAGQLKEPAFDPENPMLESLAHNIVGLLDWQTYEDFVRDLTGMLAKSQPDS